MRDRDKISNILAKLHRRILARLGEHSLLRAPFRVVGIFMQYFALVAEMQELS